MTSIKLEPIIIPGGNFIDKKSLMRAIRNSFEAEAQNVRTDFRVTAQTWNHKPNFAISRQGSNQNKIIRTVGTDDKIYKFVSGGTSVRYAVMTPGFKAKTKVKVIGSDAGQGGFSHFNFKKPKPGIKAREFDKVIKDKWQKLLPAIVARVIASEVTK